MESLKKLLTELGNPDRSNLNSWFYNASDADLVSSIRLLNSHETFELYPRNQIKEYIKFAKALLKGELIDPPSDLDLHTAPSINFFNFAKGCYDLSQSLENLIKLKYRRFIKICNFIIITEPRCVDSRGFGLKKFSRTIFHLTKPIGSFTRLMNSRYTAVIKIAFDCIGKSAVAIEKPKRFLTKVQRNRILSRCVREMVKKGRVNLEQRAFWRWMVVVDANETTKINIRENVRDDFLLLKLLAHNANLRYFHISKKFVDIWREAKRAKTCKTPQTVKITKKTRDIKANFKLKLKKKLMALTNFIYSNIDENFQKIKWFSESNPAKNPLKLKPYLRNLIHILKSSLQKRLTIWKIPQYEYEYEQYEEVVTTKVSKESQNFRVIIKPIVLYEFHSCEKIENKALYWNLRHILKVKLQNYWERWVKSKRKVDLNFSTEDTLDLSMFKLPFVRSEKLRMIVTQILALSDIRQNLPRVVISTWMQQANKHYLTISKLKVIFQNQQALKQTKQHAFTAFQLASRYQTEFTDIA